MNKAYFKEMEEKYNKKFTYLKDTYKGVHKNFTFLCPIHGKVVTTPNQHRRVGCAQCNRDKEIQTYLIDFIKKANTIHANKYDYSKILFTTNRIPVTITCPIHGDFLQSTSNHLKGHGCRKCQYVSIAKQAKKPQNLFVAECNYVHNNKYSYIKTKYINTNSKITVTCPKHGDFTQWAGHHLRGTGCPVCNPGGFNVNKPGILYYLSIAGGECYKIGITNLSVNERYSTKELNKIEILDQVYYENGQDAYCKEQAILAYYKKYQYTLTKPLASGNTELFTMDLRKLKDNNEINTIRELKTS